MVDISMSDDDTTSLVVHLMLLSLLAIGGVNTILPDLHRFVVLQHGWLTNEQFTALFALAQAAPGPNFIFVTLIGWQVSGLGGALAATAAISGPACVIAYAATRLSAHWQALKWYKILRAGMVPVTTGLMVTSAWLLTNAAAQTFVSYAITAVTAVIVLTTRLNPLWLLALAGGLGIAGLI
jgi:chromate transporter